MPVTFDTLETMLDHGFDALIDVRSPAEFAIDHVPGAINLPALSNEQRAHIGTIYKQVSPFEARKMGAALVARNVADHVDGPLANFDGSWRPLVYCWRGGQRSGSFAIIMQQIGWRAQTVDGGYMAWRRLVKRTLYDTPLPHRFILLDGNTGTAKTAILARLAARDVQVLDLEGLAGHRGSLLGATEGGQPNQKKFETALALALSKLDPDRPVIVEAESSKIGQINLPPQVWYSMINAPSIMISAPIAARAAFLETAYADVIADPKELANRLAPLRYIRGHAVVEDWLSLLAAGKFRALATALMEQHYDAAYAKSRAHDTHATLAQIRSETLDDAGQDALADAILAVIK
ncbi:tRNA 2-selenouridine(34) synthase MnmH [Yoonia sp. MH D7]